MVAHIKQERKRLSVFKSFIYHLPTSVFELLLPNFSPQARIVIIAQLEFFIGGQSNTTFVSLYAWSLFIIG